MPLMTAFLKMADCWVAGIWGKLCVRIGYS